MYLGMEKDRRDKEKSKRNCIGQIEIARNVKVKRIQNVNEGTRRENVTREKLKLKTINQTRIVTKIRRNIHEEKGKGRYVKV